MHLPNTNGENLMPNAIPALRGTFGTTEYYFTTMNIGELVRSVQFPQYLPDWG